MNERDRIGVRIQVARVVHSALKDGVTFQELRKSIIEQVGIDGSLTVFGLGGVGSWLEDTRNFGGIVRDENGIYQHAPVGGNMF